MSRRTLFACSLSLALASVLGCSRQSIVDSSSLIKADEDASNWLMYGRTYEDHRFSPLEQINSESVGNLGLVWSRELGTTRGLEATPLVKEGVIYTTGAWSVVYAIDAQTGEILWTHDPKSPRERAFFYCCDVVNRGVALYQGKVFVGTIDGRLIALDEQTGNPVWSVDTTEEGRPYSITSAPRIAHGLVVIGNGGSEYGVRGYVSAYDAETGKMAWRFYTVPGDPSKGFESRAMEAAAKTWSGEYWEAGGGGSPWEGVVYDPELDLLYFGTGNPITWYRAIRGSGDNLYAASIIAVHASTGDMAWHFQTTPGDSWDYDATQPLVQAELQIAGRPRKVIMQANKNGFFYILDRETGEFLSGTPFVGGITWAAGLDATGRPIETPGVAEMEAVIVSPDGGGAHNWNPMAFSPTTGLVYLASKEGTQMLHVPDPNWEYDADRQNIGYDNRYKGPLLDELAEMPAPIGKLLAWNPKERKEAWSVRLPVVEGGGVLATAGGLVFQGRSDGVLTAYRDTDGTELWSFDAGTGIMAPPITYTVEGVQYVTVMAGWGGAPGMMNVPKRGPAKPGFGRILTFALGGAETLEPFPYGHEGPPMPVSAIEGTAETVEEGRILYASTCFMCHGLDAVASSLPDLRYMSETTQEQFADIVLKGTLASNGMPSFANILNPDQVGAIQAYLVARTIESAEAAKSLSPE